MRTRSLAIIAALTMALAGCSGDGNDDGADNGGGTAAADGAVTFVGDDALQWADTSPSAATEGGSLEVTIECDGPVPHNVVFEGVNDDAVIAECAGDDSATATVDVEPGTYTFYCSVPGHREAGMEGEITVS